MVFPPWKPLGKGCLLVWGWSLMVWKKPLMFWEMSLLFFGVSPPVWVLLVWGMVPLFWGVSLLVWGQVLLGQVQELGFCWGQSPAQPSQGAAPFGRGL